MVYWVLSVGCWLKYRGVVVVCLGVESWVLVKISWCCVLG